MKYRSPSCVISNSLLVLSGSFSIYLISWYYQHRVNRLIIFVGCLLVRSHSNSYPVKLYHDDVIKWKHFPRNWPFARGIHRSPVNSPHRPVTRSLDVSLICARINGGVNNHGAGYLWRYQAHYNVTVMFSAVVSLDTPKDESISDVFFCYL